MADSQERDIECGYSFNRLLELGCFDREFIFSGYGYLEDGKIRYRVSSKEDSIYRAKDEGLLHGSYATPVVKKIKRLVVPSGQQEQIKHEIKMELVYEIKAMYNATYFAAVAELAKEPPNNSAYHILKTLQEEAEGRFQEDKLQMLEGLCWLALEGKVLNQLAFQEFAMWLNFMRRQMAEDIQIKDQFERTFSGFAYETVPGKVAYYLDADWATVKERHEIYKNQGKFVTPIYSKNYWFHTINEIAKVRKTFGEDIKLAINEAVIAYTKQILALPSAISAEQYQMLKETVKENCTAEAYQSFVGHGHRWHIE